MSTSPLVDPELWPILAQMPPLMDLTLAQLPKLRATMKAEPQLGQHDGIVATISEAPPGLLYLPERKQVSGRAAILYLHGGGFITGSAARDDPWCREMASALDAVILSLDYRLAPEHPWPAALDDAHNALEWLHREAVELGVDARRIAVVGNSAGAGLAASLTQSARDRGGPEIAFQVLMQPMLDDRTVGEPTSEHHVWTSALNRFAWDALIGENAGGSHAPLYSAAARIVDTGGLPSAYLGIGALDLFLGESIAYASRLLASGVSTELHVYRGAFHGFNLALGAGVARRFRRDVIEALRSTLLIQHQS